MKRKEWFTSKLADNDNDTNAVYQLYSEFIAEFKYVSRSSYERMVRHHKSKSTATEISTSKLAKELQKQRDYNRIERKTFRQSTRIENALVEYNSELIKLLKIGATNVTTQAHEINEDAPVGIIHITDAHLNELIDLPCNQYDFSIASKRLYKLAQRAISIFKPLGIREIVIAFTGDQLNSDRRLDELLSMATNRAKATILAVELFSKFILNLNEHFDVIVEGVTGNESRAKDEFGYANIVATDNYDFTIQEFLRMGLNECNGIRIGQCGYNELVINVNGKQILMLHGYTQRNKEIEDYVQKLKGKYASDGIIIDYVILGHVHSCRIGDTYARGSSLAGANEYSHAGLNLSSRASQNLYIVRKDGIDGMRIDLQNTKEYNGYSINDRLAEYNVKSHNRLLEYRITDLK